MTLDAFEFIRRFFLHVLPDGFVKISHFGFLSNRHRNECLEACRTLLGVKTPEPASSETWQESLLRISGIDVTRCPLCEGRMRRKELYGGHREERQGRAENTLSRPRCRFSSPGTGLPERPFLQAVHLFERTLFALRSL